MSSLGTGAGAAEGLDSFLAQELMRQKFDQSKVEHNDEVALKTRQLDQTGATGQSEAELRAAQTRKILDDQKEAEHQRELRAALKTNAPTQPQRDFVAGEEAGVKFPFELLTQPDGLVKPTPAVTTGSFMLNGKPVVGQRTHDGKVIVAGEDVTDKVTPFTPPQQGSVIQGPEGFFRAIGNKAEPITTGGAQVESKPPAQVLQRQDMATRVGSHFADLSQELDEAEKQGLLGPLAGRTVSDFLGSGVGSTGDPVKDELLGNLRMDLSGVVTGFGSLHGRGGANAGIANKLALDAFNAKKMSHAELKGGVDSLKKWVDTYAAPMKSGVASASSTGNGGAPAGAAPDAYDEYLKRSK